MFCADLAYLPHWETQMDLLVKSHFDCFEHVLLKNSKGSNVSFGNLLVTLLIYINMSCKLKKNYTIENDHKILTQRIYMIRPSICVQQRKLCCLSRGRFTSPHSKRSMYINIEQFKHEQANIFINLLHQMNFS